MTMGKTAKLLGVATLIAISTALVLLPMPASPGIPQNANGSSLSEEPVPAFHAKAPQGELPATMEPALFPDPVVQNAYALAAKIKKTLYQEPCYCHCDRSQGHGSLLDCFASRHGSGCNICIYEDLYTYEQSRKGKSAAQIRAGIIKGEWQNVDISKYRKPLSSD
jgi:hypothetical protein